MNLEEEELEEEEQEEEKEDAVDDGEGEGVDVCLPIEIGRDADGDVAPVEGVNINHCNHTNDENEI